LAVKGTNHADEPYTYMGKEHRLELMHRTRKVIEMFIDEDDPYWGVNAISVVGTPAIEKNFIAFSKEQTSNEIKLMNEERRIIVGPVLIPELKIPRRDTDGSTYEIFFSQDTVRKVAHLYLKRDLQHNTTIQHQGGLIKGCTVVESWLVEGPMDKAVHLGYQVPVGTWMAAMKVDDENTWQAIKRGELKGYSIEGMFTELAEHNENELTMKSVTEALKSILQF
jgi:hypothetical protein